MNETDKARIRVEVKKRLRSACCELEEAIWAMAEGLSKDEAARMFQDVEAELCTVGTFDFWAAVQDYGTWELTRGER